MDEDLIINALSGLSKMDERLGPYCGHSSTSKGITVRTPKRAFTVRASLLAKLVYEPESLTKEGLKRELNLED